MAEYNDVIEHFKRMCRYYNPKTTQNDCQFYCKGHGCNISHCRMLAFEDKKFAKVVMAWAAEHPEPEYPTWGEWLMEIGILKGNKATGFSINYDVHIPADIVEKLGLKPKENK